MDKKSVVGLIIIAVILFGFTWYNSKQAEKFREAKIKADSIALAEGRLIAEPEPLPTAVATDSLRQSAFVETPVRTDSVLASHLGATLFAATKGEEKFYTIENDLFKLTVSNKGGKVSQVELKDYKKYDGTPLLLFADNSSVFDLSFFIKQNFNDAQIFTGDYYFRSEQPQHIVVSGDEGEELSMRLYVDSTSYVEYLYTVYKDNYMIGYRINFVNMEHLLANQSDMLFTWENVGPQNEKGFENENNYTTISYKFPGEDGIESLGISKSSKEEDINSKLQWIAFKQQFFSSIFIADDNFLNASLKYDTYQPNDSNIKKFNAKIAVPFDKQTTQYDYRFYFGPNKYSILKKYDIEAQKLIPLGGWIIGWVNRWLVIPVFDFLGKYIANYGLIILLLTIIIKVIISPLTYKSYLSTAKMRLLKPEMDAISEKYPKKEDAMKKQQAIMELYRKAGVSPMGGCIPLLIQFPILIAMYRFFPASIELRGEHFLWADDLSSYDSILQLPFNIPFYGDHVSLFALLMAVSMYVVTRVNYTNMSTAPNMAGMKFVSLYMMPLMLLCWFNNSASGLSYYYMLSNIITLGQTIGFRYIVNDEKLHARMKANAKKTKKKSKWQQRYEEMLKAQQQQARRR